MKIFNNLKFGVKLWVFASIMIVAIIVCKTAGGLGIFGGCLEKLKDAAWQPVSGQL